MTENLSKERCILLLQEKYKEKGKLPQKSDFTDYEVMMIKSHLGPWPRALEASGIKEPRSQSKIIKRQEKRERAKKRKLDFKNKSDIL